MKSPPDLLDDYKAKYGYLGPLLHSGRFYFLKLTFMDCFVL